MTLKEMRDELRELRKAADHRPISRMKKGDISQEIEKLKLHRESTPPAASYTSAPTQVSKSAVESVKEAKKHEFPVEHTDEKHHKAVHKAAAHKAAAHKAAPKAPKEALATAKPTDKGKLAKLMALMAAME